MHTTQIFTGLEDADLKFMCDDRKNDEKSGKIKGVKTTNVICNGNVVSADDIISPQKASSISPAIIAKSFENGCYQLLNGYVTVEDIFSN